MAGMGFFDRVYEIVKEIPHGYVMTYGQIAMLAGNPRAARTVGWAMSAAPKGLPCHRVVNKSGELREDIFGGVQRRMLEEEGVPFKDDGRIDARSCLWWG